MKTKSIFLSGVFTFSAGLGLFLASEKGNEFYSPRVEKDKGYKITYGSEERTIQGAIDQMYALRLNQNTGTVNPEDVRAAYEQANTNAKNFKAGSPLIWKEMGPDNVGGRTRGFLIDSRNRNHLYSCSVGGGLWKSTTGGQSWFKINDQSENLAVVSIAQTPDGTIYYGTGEQQFTNGADGSGNSGVMGGGVWKSTDGVNFTRLASTTSGSQWNNVSSMAADPKTNRVYAGNDGGVYWSEDEGKTWTKVTTPFGGVCREVKVAKDGTVLVHVGSRLYLSKDGKTNYTQVGTNSIIPISNGRLSMAFAPSDPNYIYVMAAKPNSAGSGLEGVYRSTDQGETWSKIVQGGSVFFDPLSQTMTLQGQGTYDNVIAVHPLDKDRIYMAGVRLGEWTLQNGAKYLGTNGFQHPTNTLYIHADKHGIDFDASVNPPIMYISTDGGVYKTINEGKSFIPCVNGHNTTQFYGVAANEEGHIFGGSQDNGNQYINFLGNTRMSAIEVKGGDGFHTEFSRLDSRIVFAEYINGTVQRSFNRGSSFSDFWDNRINNSQSYSFAPFNAPFMLWENLEDSTNFFALGVNNAVWLTKGALVAGTTPSWFKVSTGSGIAQCLQFSPDGNTMFVGASSGSRITRTTGLLTATFDTSVVAAAAIPPGLTVTNVTGNLPAGRAITNIAIDPNNPNRMIVTLGNYGNNDYVFITNNAMDPSPTYTSIQKNLPKMPVYDAVINIDNPQNIILATELGIWSSEDGGNSWVESNNGMARVAVYRIRQYEFRPWEGPRLYIGTHGRGFFESRTLMTGAKGPKSTMETKIKLFPNPAVNSATAEFNLSKNSDVNVTVVDIQGKVVYSESFKNMAAGSNNFEINTSGFKSGNYFVTVESKDSRSVNKLVVVK